MQRIALTKVYDRYQQKEQDSILQDYAKSLHQTTSISTIDTNLTSSTNNGQVSALFFNFIFIWLNLQNKTTFFIIKGISFHKKIFARDHLMLLLLSFLIFFILLKALPFLMTMVPSLVSVLCLYFWSLPFSSFHPLMKSRTKVTYMIKNVYAKTQFSQQVAYQPNPKKTVCTLFL